MRLFEFVPCGRRGVPIDDDGDGSCVVPTAVVQRHHGVPTVVNQVSRGLQGENRRRKSTTTTTKTTAVWKPSLGAISEDGTVLMKSKVSSNHSVRQEKTQPTTRKAKKVIGAGQSRQFECEDLRYSFSVQSGESLKQ